MSKELRNFKLDDFDQSIKDIKKLTNFEYAQKMHEELVNATKLLKGLKTTYDMGNMNDLLIKHPSYYSWSLFIYELMKSELEGKKEAFDFKKKDWFRTSSHGLEKATVKKIESEMYAENHDEYNDFNKEIRDLATKVDLAHAMSKVWEKSISTIQSASKNISIEFEAAKRNL